MVGLKENAFFYAFNSLFLRSVVKRTKKKQNICIQFRVLRRNKKNLLNIVTISWLIERVDAAIKKKKNSGKQVFWEYFKNFVHAFACTLYRSGGILYVSWWYSYILYNIIGASMPNRFLIYSIVSRISWGHRTSEDLQYRGIYVKTLLHLIFYPLFITLARTRPVLMKRLHCMLFVNDY